MCIGQVSMPMINDRLGLVIRNASCSTYFAGVSLVEALRG